MGAKIKSDERRKFKRIPFTQKIRYKDFYNPLQVFRSAPCVNLGLEGACFETFESLALEKILTILVDIPAPGSYQSLQAKIFAKVVYLKKLENKRCSVGVHFIAVDRKGAIALGQMIDRELRASVQAASPVVAAAPKKLEKVAAGF